MSFFGVKFFSRIQCDIFDFSFAGVVVYPGFQEGGPVLGRFASHTHSRSVSHLHLNQNSLLMDSINSGYFSFTAVTNLCCVRDP